MELFGPTGQSIVLLDIDNVVKDYIASLHLRFYKETGFHITRGEWTAFNSRDCEPLRRLPENYHKVLDRIMWELKTHADALPVPGALSGVNQLREMGYKLLFVTAAHPRVANVKLDWMVDHGFCESMDVIFTPYKHVVRGNCLVDDHLKNIQQWDAFSGYDHSGIVLDEPWNRENGEAYHRAQSWAEIPNLVRQVIERQSASKE